LGRKSQGENSTKKERINMKNVAFHNLGCKVNSYEIDVMQQMLQESGYNVVPFDAIADIYIVNTCTVTNIADRKSRQMLHRAKAKNPDAIVVAVGCYVQTDQEAVKKDDCIDLAIGNNRKKDLAGILAAFLADRDDKTLHDSTIIKINEPCAYEEMTLKQTAEHTRAYIKIQDGCNQFCSYCIIPFARGRVRSRRAEDIMNEIQGLAAAGFKEVVLTGIHLSSYGIDQLQEETSGHVGLIELVEQIHGIEGLQRIRLGSLEPRIITRDNAQRLAALPKVCPHFHLSLQSGCDEILKRMNRHYTTGEYYLSVEELRRTFTNPAITTDIIVGFPGETEADFEETMQFAEKISFYEMHVFKFSGRKGTPAAKMAGQIPEKVKSDRSSRLISLGSRQQEEYARQYIGREAEVLFEEVREIGGKQYQIGHTDNYMKIALAGDVNLSNCLKKVRITGFLDKEIMNCISMD